MQVCYLYNSPLGEILLTADDVGLTGLYVAEQRAGRKPSCPVDAASPAIVAATKWLDAYFAGNVPDFTPALHLVGTPFQLSVWQELLQIPYGKTVTYGEIARTLAVNTGVSKMSAQAVGGAVGRNPISIVVPCHRVMGANGNLTGYGGGLHLKIALLKLENAFGENFHLPRK